MNETIPNSELRIELLPSVDDPRKVAKFAHLFNGYDHYGSFEACADKALARTRESITEIRNELFFSVRASRHSGDRGFIEHYRELLPILKHKIEKGEFT